MDFALTDEQHQIQQAARALLDGRYPPQRISELADSAAGADPEVWPELAGQGWLDPGLGTVELGLLAEIGGYTLLPAPWWQTAGPAAVIRAAAGEKETSPAAVAGLLSPNPTVHAIESGTGWALSGEALGIPDAGSAAEILTPANLAGGIGLFSVSVHDAEVLPCNSLDTLRRSADLRFTAAPARLLAGREHAPGVFKAASRSALALLACEAVGVAQRGLDMAVEYAKVRTQFERPIGSFQAVGHRLADAYAEVELARSLAYRAAWLTGADDSLSIAAEADRALATATVASRRAAVVSVESAMQVIGGTAMTWEYPLHRWYRRALWLQAFGGGQRKHLATLASGIFGE